MRSRLLIAAIVALALTSVSAGAASFDVVSCAAAPGNANHAWLPESNSPALTAAVSCPPTASSGEATKEQGIAVYTTLLGGTPPAGTQAAWSFTAPSSTTITRLRYYRYLGKYDDPDWDVTGETGEGLVFDTCEYEPIQGECAVGAPGYQQGAFHNVPGLSTNQLIVGMVCQAAPYNCSTGATIHRAWAAIYASTVTIDDPTAPQLGSLTGPLVANPTAWHKGAEQASLSAQDNTGIKRTELLVDGQLRSASDELCDYTYPAPCPGSVSVSHTVDWGLAGLADGPHSVQGRALDAAGNAALTDAVTVNVDATPPTMPTNVTVVPVESPGSFQVAWTVPDQGQGAPVVGAHLEVCPRATISGCQRTDAHGLGIRAATITVATPGTYDGRVWLEDAAGNTSTANASFPVSFAYAPAGAEGGGRGAGGTLVEGATLSPGPLVTRLPARLRLSRAVIRRRSLFVTGRIRQAARGRVTVSYRARVGSDLVVVSTTAAIRHGAFRARLTLPVGWRPRAGSRAVVRYAGSETVASASARRRVSIESGARGTPRS